MRWYSLNPISLSHNMWLMLVVVVVLAGWLAGWLACAAAAAAAASLVEARPPTNAELWAAG